MLHFFFIQMDRLQIIALLLFVIRCNLGYSLSTGTITTTTTPNSTPATTTLTTTIMTTPTTVTTPLTTIPATTTSATTPERTTTSITPETTTSTTITPSTTTPEELPSRTTPMRTTTTTPTNTPTTTTPVRTTCVTSCPTSTSTTTPITTITTSTTPGTTTPTSTPTTTTPVRTTCVTSCSTSTSTTTPITTITTSTTPGTTTPGTTTPTTTTPVTTTCVTSCPTSTPTSTTQTTTKTTTTITPTTTSTTTPETTTTTSTTPATTTPTTTPTTTTITSTTPSTTTSTTITPSTTTPEVCHIHPPKDCCIRKRLRISLEDHVPVVFGKVPYVSVMEQTNGKESCGCDAKILLKATFQKNSANDTCQGCTKVPMCGNKMLRIDLEMAPTKTGVSFHVGDSRTNNGYNGDASTQENDAEFHSSGNGHLLYGSNKCPNMALIMTGLLSNSVTSVTIFIGNEFIRVSNNLGYVYELCSECLFSLNGQSDSQGPVNEDIFISLNRIIDSSSYREGTGVCSAVISWACPWDC